MSNTIVIAKTQPRDSYQNVGEQFYTEYGISYVDKELERDELVKKYGCKELWGFFEPCTCVRRKVKIIENELFYGEWEVLDFGDGIIDCSRRFGDSAYYSATSLHYVHEWEVERASRVYLLQTQLKNLEDEIIPNKFQRLSKLAAEFNDRYESELKSKKIFKKSQNGTAPAEVIDEIKTRLKLEYNIQLKTIEDEIEKIKTELKDLGSK
jgi:hypothetical protein